jgi:alpha-beta hydrolase superfamily lysophospholipase
VREHNQLAQPVWIGDERPVFGMYHAPSTDLSQPRAVLFCAPFGWEDMGSYPVRLLWANRLAEDGYRVLRFDLPGTGQSAGSPGDPEQLQSWLHSIAQTASWLRHASQSSHVAAIGIGLGGLLALAATGDGAPIDDLVLWGVPTSGRALTRRLLAFARLQTAASERPDSALPAGWLQSGGYVLSEETLTDLGALRADTGRVGGLRRVLLLDQDGSAVEPSLSEHLQSAGVEVQIAHGPGYAAMLDSPEISAAPLATIATVRDWLGRGEQAQLERREETAPPSRDSLELRIGGVAVSERAFTVRRASADMFGVLAQPGERSPNDLCLICLPALAERCIGPSRMWVEMARRHATQGVSSLRIDLESIGDSTGSRDSTLTTADVWSENRVSQVKEVMDALQGEGHGSRFLLIGLCTGAYWAQRIATVDSRVVAVLSLNPAMSHVGLGLLERHGASRALVILKPAWWRKLIRGEVSSKGITTVSRGLEHRLTSLLSSRGQSTQSQSEAQESTFAVMLDQLQRRGARMTIGFATLEPGYHQLEVEGIAQHPERWPALRIHRFESTDHNLRELHQQRTIHELLDELVRDVLSARD